MRNLWEVKTGGGSASLGVLLFGAARRGTVELLTFVFPAWQRRGRGREGGGRPLAPPTATAGRPDRPATLVTGPSTRRRPPPPSPNPTSAQRAGQLRACVLQHTHKHSKTSRPSARESTFYGLVLYTSSLDSGIPGIPWLGQPLLHYVLTKQDFPLSCFRSSATAESDYYQYKYNYNKGTNLFLNHAFWLVKA